MTPRCRIHVRLETTQLYAQIRPARLKQAVGFYEERARVAVKHTSAATLEVGSPLGHPPAPAARAEPAALARKRLEAVQPAAVTPQPREAVRQDAVPEERPKLLLHESGQAGPVRPGGRLVQERLQMLANDGVEHGVFSIPWAGRPLPGGPCPLCGVKAPTGTMPRD
jgi:hypothetical protein